MLKKKYYMFVLNIVFSALLIGCSTETYTPSKNLENSYGNSAVSRMPVKNYIKQHRATIEFLSANGVQFIQTGDELVLVLSTDQFFVKKTPILATQYYSVLTEVAKLLKNHEKFSIKIAGYTDNLGSVSRNIALSRAQALSMADYLWKQGVDTRLIYSTGYGTQQPIASNITEQGRTWNRRIEIILRWVTDPKQG